MKMEVLTKIVNFIKSGKSLTFFEPYYLFINENINLQDQNGRTLLSHACEAGHIEVTLFLLKNPLCSAGIKDFKNWYPLHYASYYSHFSVLKALFDHTKNIQSNIKNNKGLTPLHILTASNQYHMVEFLLHQDIDINHQDTSGWTALHYAASNQFTRILELLLLFEADVFVQDIHGKTALFVACERGYIDCCLSLILSGSDVRHKSNTMESIVEMAEKKKLDKIVKLLYDAGAGVILEENLKPQI